MPLIGQKPEVVRRVGIVGSLKRKSPFDRDVVFDIVCQEIDRNSPIELVSGGCSSGADAFAEEAAEYYNLPKTIHAARHTGVSFKDRINALHARGELIAGDSDIIYALVDENRTGDVEAVIRYAWDFKVPVVTCLPNGKRYAQFGNAGIDVIATAAMDPRYSAGEACVDCGANADTGWRLCSKCLSWRDSKGIPVATEIFRP